MCDVVHQAHTVLEHLGLVGLLNAAFAGARMAIVWNFGPTRKVNPLVVVVATRRESECRQKCAVLTD